MRCFIFLPSIRSAGSMAERLTTNQEVPGSTPGWIDFLCVTTPGTSLSTSFLFTYSPDHPCLDGNQGWFLRSRCYSASTSQVIPRSAVGSYIPIFVSHPLSAVCALAAAARRAGETASLIRSKAILHINYLSLSSR